MDNAPWRAGVAVLVGLPLALSACSDDDPVRDEAALDRVIELPGERLFPEGVATDPRTGTIYVGSTEDGSVLRADPEDGRAEVFLPGDADGRTAATGLAVDGDRLFVAGRDTGRIFVHDTRSGEQVAAFDTPGGDAGLVNDVTVTADAAYVTDSFQPVLWRLDLSGGSIGAPRPWLRLDGSPIEYGDGFNLNGLTSNEDGTILLTVHSSTGELFRIETATGSINQVDLGGESLAGGDGLELDGTTLYSVAGGDLVTVALDDALASGRVTDRAPLDGVDYPTTLALTDDDFVVVGSQLDMTGGDDEPQLPFTLTLLRRP